MNEYTHLSSSNQDVQETFEENVHQDTPVRTGVIDKAQTKRLGLFLFTSLIYIIHRELTKTHGDLKITPVRIEDVIKALTRDHYLKDKITVASLLLSRGIGLQNISESCGKYVHYPGRTGA